MVVRGRLGLQWPEGSRAHSRDLVLGATLAPCGTPDKRQRRSDHQRGEIDPGALKYILLVDGCRGRIHRGVLASLMSKVGSARCVVSLATRLCPVQSTPWTREADLRIDEMEGVPVRWPGGITSHSDYDGLPGSGPIGSTRYPLIGFSWQIRVA
jgi:hypothetical protein